ncbi:hypothetical protein [Nocardia mangyaensis]|uniref:hypothetical protein n=1 Tax=Nocardia mangyaensis TaxID=2213200 RepID=UPI0026752E38|nr:hypothetical protein [Nocardia mangyaensis]MDO3645669.1 hypothetical protein [Nocardia mangyaensis]
MTASGGLPNHESVARELRTVREKGLGALRRLKLTELHRVARQIDLTTTDAEPEPAAVEALVRQAVDHLDGGEFQEAAEYTFGLVGGTKFAPSTERRRQAAKAANVQPETFRKGLEKDIIEQTAEAVLALCHDAAMRRAHLAMERRHPAESRLAVAWVERFEAYYRIWTPAYALGADLRAALQTYQEEPADHLPWDPDSEEPFDPVREAQGYARSALHWYARFLLEVRRFMAKHGGLWLLSDTEVENDVRDAVYRVGWHNPINEENDSWLRRTLATRQLEEAELFYRALESTADGEMIHAIWQKFVLDGHEAEVDGDTSKSQIHSTIQACDDYTSKVDADWMKIADWYAPGQAPPRGVDGAGLYERLVSE